MYEKPHQPLLKMHRFVLRLLCNIAVGSTLILVALLIGMWGYHYYEKLSWIDAFANASMILSGMGPFGPLTTSAGKVFAGIYAIFSGLSFILIIGIVFAPVFHRFFHKFHLTDDTSKD